MARIPVGSSRNKGAGVLVLWRVDDAAQPAFLKRVFIKTSGTRFPKKSYFGYYENQFLLIHEFVRLAVLSLLEPDTGLYITDSL